MHTKLQNESFDVVIVGAGVVGLTLACLLGDTKLKIALLDERPLSTTLPKSHDLRVSAIIPASQQIFAQLNVWQQLPMRRISAFDKMYVWEAAGNAIEFDCAKVAASALGYIIENNLLQWALNQQLSQYSNIKFITHHKLQKLHLEKSSAQLELDDATQLTTKLVVGADGANSLVRRLAAMDLDECDYQHTSIVATVKTQNSHQRTAWQCFLTPGPLAFLPLSDVHTSSIVWSTEPAEAERLMKMETAEFQSALASAFSFKLGEITECSERLSFPLRMRHAKQYTKPCVALIGDAAHTVHPLAGQGVNLGILDAAYLAEVILNAPSVNSVTALRKYERTRKSDNAAMLAIVAGFKKLFTVQAAPIKFLRNIGIDLTNRFSLLKNYLMKQAMGYRNF